MNNKMYLNVIHRVDSEEKDINALKFQLQEAHRLNLKVTNLVTYPALFKGEIVSYIKGQKAIYGDEIGIHFHCMVNEEFKEQFKTEEQAIYFYSVENKKAIITSFFEKFKEGFGFYPESVGSYILDAQTINIIKEKYPSVKVSIINCFEEGVKMYEGNNHSWYLFSDGGPWGAYYPSKTNSLCPALGSEDDAGIVGLPHLNRDMLLALTSRDDYFASHPINLMRAKINNGNESMYMYRFIDKWIEQAKYNGYSYYSFFVSSPWIAPGQGFIDSLEDAKELYTKALCYLKKKIDEGKVESLTMTEFADWYRENVEIANHEVNLWEDILCGSKRQMFWFVDPYFRVAVDPNMGGSICDLRAYSGRLEKNLGPDTEHLWNGNYPFLISTEHRGGPGGTIHTFSISCNGITKMIHEYRTKCHSITTAEGYTGVVMDPIEVCFGDVMVTAQSSYLFYGGGKILIERMVKDISSLDVKVTLTEIHRGGFGTTQYPEDMRGIELSIANSSGLKKTIKYDYKCRCSEVKEPLCVEAVIPQINSKVTLMPYEPVDEGSFKEGYLFAPFYTLSLNKLVTKGGTLKSWLKIEKI